MDNDYFDSLRNSILGSDNNAGDTSETSGKALAFLTVKVDIDCKIYCDGDFLDLFEANKVKKIPIETGQHLMTVESEHCDGVSEDHVIDAAEAGKNYLLLVNGLKQKEEMFRLEQDRQERELQEREKMLRESEPYAVLSDNNTTLTFYFDNQKKRRKGMDLKLCSDFSTTNWYCYSEEITRVIFDDSFSNCHCIESTVGWFFNFLKLISIKGLHNLHTENVTDMSCMFDECRSLKELDLSNFDTSRVTSMYALFRHCQSLQELDLSNFDTSRVRDMGDMFYDCNSLQKLDLSNFDTRSVTDMSCMFRDCSSLQKLDLSNFDTSNVTRMTSMFDGCSSLQETKGLF